uniref:Uncharacterized protein n=1 Tax=Nannospalax galili TaxID=1026970 RepID=A0A8C6QTG3_NANGA
QAYSICVSSFSEISTQTAETSASLAKAYAMSGESQHRATISAYQQHWSPGSRQVFRLLMSSLNSQIGNYGDCAEKVAKMFYNLGSICFAKGDLKKAIQLLRKCLMIQILVYGSEHRKSRETKNLLSLLQRATLSRWRREAIPERKATCKDRGT